MDNVSNLVIENLREIHIINDFFNILKECRESVYYLESVKILIENHVLLKDDYEENKIKDFITDIDMYLNLFYGLEDRLSVTQNASIEDNIKVNAPLTHYRLEDLPELLLGYIELKSKIDKLQLDILEYLIKVKIKLCDEISNRDNSLMDINIQYKNESHMKLALNKSTESDKVITYMFKCENNEIKQYLINNGYDFSKRYKIRDYTYNLKIARDEYEKWQVVSINLTTMIPKIEEKKLLSELSKKQYILSRQVTILTWIITILTIFSVIFGAISTFYNIKINGNIFRGTNFFVIFEEIIRFIFLEI